VLNKLMNKKNAILRGICFVIVYSLFYVVPVFVLRTVPISLMKRLPSLIGNLCFLLPQDAFPFDIIFWKYHSLNDHAALLVSAVYLILLAWLFSFLARSVQKIRWIILFAFCFSIISVIALNLVLSALGVFGITVEPSMP